MIPPSTLSEKQTENGQIIRTEKFVRNSGSYKIADIVEKVQSHMKTTHDSQLTGRKTALISGAGIAGLAAAFELNAKGFDVVIAENRDEFSRFNILTLKMEVQAFLKKFSLLEEFEKSVAARIEDHQKIIFRKESIQSNPPSNVSKLQFEGPLDKDSIKFKNFFKEHGIYCVQIKDLQAFLAQKAAQLGVQILSGCDIKFFTTIEKERVSKVEIRQKNESSSPLIFEPDLFFIAEGTHPISAQQLEMVNDSEDIVNNACTGENWVFGNLSYHGDKTFVVSMIMTAQKTLQIANVIFNAKSQVVNVAVTSNENLNHDDIVRLILTTAKKVFDYKGITEPPKIIEIVKKPTKITNQIASLCSKGNIFRIGDAVGHSSPLAGLGGTLGLTLVPFTIEQLLDDYQKGSDELHSRFKTHSQAYVKTWIDKSESVKESILGIFDGDQSSEIEPKKPTPLATQLKFLDKSVLNRLYCLIKGIHHERSCAL